jgi:hypothetical protein
MRQCAGRRASRRLCLTPHAGSRGIALLRRHRWAWIFSVLLIGSFVVLYPFQGGRVVDFILQLAAVALLLSRPMRQHVGIRLGRWRFASRSAKPS